MVGTKQRGRRSRVSEKNRRTFGQYVHERNHPRNPKPEDYNEATYEMAYSGPYEFRKQSKGNKKKYKTTKAKSKRK